jgi:hypothetical protein
VEAVHFLAHVSTVRNERRHTATRTQLISVIRSGQVRSGQVRSGQVRSGHGKPGQVRSGQVMVSQGRAGTIK